LPTRWRSKQIHKNTGAREEKNTTVQDFFYLRYDVGNVKEMSNIAGGHKQSELSALAFIVAIFSRTVMIT
jgi:hypothetical protein